ncbi:TIGR03960 family B12-binding radical SAM protein [bacterium]|nr:TIGR03960 family B12-binding radical SAM protein [bacterium]
MPVCAETYERLLARVEKPGRYLGNELGVVRKDPAAVELRFALAFPEVYEIAQSHPGLQLLYDLLNRRPDVYAERVYAPWFDLEAVLRRAGHPLVSLETYTPLREFDLVGFSLQYELTYTNILAMLDLGGIPLRAAARGADDPLVVAGGPCAFNPEPIADFLDAVLLGDGEEAIHDLCEAYKRWNGRDRGALLAALAEVPGVYVPAFYAPQRDARGRLVAVAPRRPELPPVVEKRILRDLDAVPIADTHVVPNIRVVHGRPSLEVMRGCVKGCRFCQAGYIYRPLRERDPRRVLAQAERAVAATGSDELSLLSLSTGDYSCVNPVLTELMNRFAGERVAVSLPSTRVDALAPSLLEQIRRVRKTGFTLAPEAGSQRLRDIIQKEYEEEELIEAARQIFGLGWRALKLYFMLGLPGEDETDLVAIADLAAKVAATGKGRVEVTASVSTFVPKPHTPFQWSAQIDVAETEARQSLLRRELGKRRIRFKWHDARTSYLEGIFSRGGRELAPLLLAAYARGCRFDGWTEHCRFDAWEAALAETGIEPSDYLRRRYLNEALPWDHLSSGVTKAYLQRELAYAVEGRLTPDCSIERCTYCGACDFTQVRNVTYHLKGAKGGEHRGAVVDNWAHVAVGGELPAAPGSWEPRGWQKLQQKQAAGRRAQRPRQPASVAAPPPPAAPAPAAAQPGLGNAEEWINAGTEALAPPIAILPPRMRIRLTYAKRARARFISHLELIEVFDRACRRAHLPLAFSQGHRPAPRLRFSPGLPVGAESDCEAVDIDLTAALPVDEIARRFGAHLPDGLTILAAEAIALRAPSLEHDLVGFRYRVDIGELFNGDGGAWIDARLSDFLARDAFPLRKRGGRTEKTVDARPLVHRLIRVAPHLVEIDVAFSPAGSLKPTELLAALLDLDVETARALPLTKTHAFRRGADAPQVAAASASA